MDDSEVEVAPPLAPEASPAPPAMDVPLVSKPAKVLKVESYVFPRFDTVDVTLEKGVRDMQEAFADAWGAHPQICMQPVPALTKLGWDGKPVDIGAPASSMLLLQTTISV